MLKVELTSEERERQKAARRRFREIVKQRWEEETLKNLSKKAFQKISKKQSPISPPPLGGGGGEFPRRGKRGGKAGWQN